MRHFKVKNTAYVLFEPDEKELTRIATSAGFQVTIERRERVLLIALAAKQARPMFFDAADQREASRMALARTFASGTTGVVFNTPFVLEPRTRTEGAILVRLATEVRWDIARKFPQGPTESSLLALFQQLVTDLAGGMVGLCGLPGAGRALANPAP